jgi:hypothetical protein
MNGPPPSLHVGAVRSNSSTREEARRIGVPCGSCRRHTRAKIIRSPQKLKLEVRPVSKMGTAVELLEFLKVNKKLWLVPMMLVLLLLAAIFALGQFSAVAPFIYTIF